MIYRGLASAGLNCEVGHEVSGIVIETGRKVTSFKPGDKVVVSLNTPCGDCPMCHEGRPSYCLNMHIESHGMKVAEPNPSKRNLALSFGAAKAFDPYTDGYLEEVNNYSQSNGYDVVIEASGNPASAKIAFHFVGHGGSLLLFGLYGMNFELPLNLFNLYWTDANICAVLPSTVLYPNAIKLAPRLKLNELITAEFPFEQVADAFKEKDSGNHAKVILFLSTS